MLVSLVALVVVAALPALAFMLLAGELRRHGGRAWAALKGDHGLPLILVSCDSGEAAVAAAASARRRADCQPLALAA